MIDFSPGQIIGWQIFILTSIFTNFRHKYCTLSHKLRCYTRISGPKKSRKNTREKISYSFTCADIANQLLIRHSPLMPRGQVDE